MPQRRILFVISPERFRDEELGTPRQALVGAGHRVSVASTRPCIAVGMLGARERVASSVTLADGEAADLIVVVGGYGAPDHLWNHEPLLNLVRRRTAAGKPCAAICLGAAVLARAGILSGRRATVFPERRAVLELKRGGARYVDEPVVQDGPVLTARGPEAAEAFGAALLSLLGTP